MTRLLWRQNLRWLLRSPWQALVPLLGVALGVAGVVAIDLAKRSALESFRISTDNVVGRATHALVGGPAGIDEALYRRLRLELGWRLAAPVVEGTLLMGDRSIGLLGIDPLADAPMRPHLAGSAAPGGANTALMTQPGAVVLAAETAAAMGFEPGTRREGIAGGRRHSLALVATLEPADEFSRAAIRDLLISDIATAQEVLGLTGRLTRIDLIASEDEAGREAVAALEAELPAGVSLVRSAVRTRSIEQMTEAFRTNLSALSLLGLLVGVFLIYNSLTFSVVQRRTLFGRLKSIGVTQSEILWLILGEGLLIGVSGSIIGLALGALLAEQLLGPVTQTIADLYAGVGGGGVALSPQSLALGFGLGIVATLVASLVPAWEAMSSPTAQVLARSNLESQTHARVPWLAAGGVVLLVAASLLLQLSGRSLIAGLSVLIITVIAYALFVPGLVVLAMAAVRPAMRRLGGPIGAMACRGVTASLSRTGVAIAALAVALSVTVGVDVMVGSFRDSVNRWLTNSLRSDIYVSSTAPDSAGGPTTAIPFGLRERYDALPDVVRTSTNRTVVVRSERGPIDLAALDQGIAEYAAGAFVEGTAEETWESFRDGEGVVVPEPLAYRLALSVGDPIEIETEAGLHAFTIIAKVRSYASDRGVLLMHRRTYDRHYDDPIFNAIGVEVREGASVDGVREAMQALTPADVAVRIRSSRSLREASLEVFDRTFAVTQVLRAIALLVAFAGVVGALFALALERRREFGILRATGLLPEQVRRLVLLQTGLLGLVAGVLSLPLGLGIGWLLVHVINMRSFGWSLDFVATATPLVQAVALALAAALLGGIQPAIAMARMRTADALREE